MIEILFFLGIIVPFVTFQGLHTVTEGHVGIYFRGGAILDGYTEPGWHVKLPFVTSVEQIQVSVQTDEVRDVPCGTSGGVLIEFGAIEVVNRLNKELAQETVKNYTINYDKTWIFDKIHHEINQFCSKHTLQQVFIDEFDTLDENLVEQLNKDLKTWAPGIDILSIRVSKPRIPDQLLKNYEKIESEKTKLQIVAQEQKVTQQRAETEMISARIRAESEAEIVEIQLKKQLSQKEADRQIADIENSIFLSTETSKADATHYKLMKMIEAEQLQLTEEYLQKLAIEALTTNTKFFFGDSIPAFISQNIAGLNGKDD